MLKVPSQLVHILAEAPGSVRPGAETRSTTTRSVSPKVALKSLVISISVAFEGRDEILGGRVDLELRNLTSKADGQGEQHADDEARASAD